MLLEGMQLGRYQLLKRIGGGGMGDVYLAEDPQIGQKVAIKVIKTEATLNIDTIVAQNFLEEARAIAQLDHSHIMPLLSYGEEQVHGDTVAYIVMPYRKEGNLIQWLRSQTDVVTLVERGRLIQQAASALKYAHDRNIIHRDVKPSNFLVRENLDSPRLPDLLLSDFGLAKLLNATSSASQNVRGTPAYMAPEQWGGTSVAASDQYSLAVMAFELLTGQTPFQGNPLQMMHDHLNQLPPSPGSFNPSLPEGVDKVLLCALQKRPSDRYPSVAAFADNLLNALQGLEYTTNTGKNDTVIAGDSTANSQEQATVDASDSTFLKKPDPELGLSTVQASYRGEAQSRTLEIVDTRPAEGETPSGILQPISSAPFRSRSLRTKILFSILAAGIVLSLIISSIALALLTHNNAGNLNGANAQSAFSHNNASPGTHATAHPTPSVTAQKHHPTPGSAHQTPTPVTGFPTSQPTSNPTTQPAATPTPRPTTQPTPTPTPQPTYQPTPTPTPQPTLCLNVGAQSLSLTGTQGQSYSNQLNYTITNCSSIVETWISYQNTQGSWIRNTQTSNTLNPGTYQSEGAFASLSGLSAGTYSGYLYYYIGSAKQATITVTLTVQPPALCLQSNASSLSLTGTQGQPYSNELYITVTNCSSVVETWTSYQNTQGNWIITTQTSNTLNPETYQTVGVYANLSGLSTGTYSGYLYFYIGSAREVTITVTLTVY